jgi:hypothetical protein
MSNKPPGGVPLGDVQAQVYRAQKHRLNGMYIAHCLCKLLETNHAVDDGRPKAGWYILSHFSTRFSNPPNLLLIVEKCYVHPFIT